LVFLIYFGLVFNNMRVARQITWVKNGDTIEVVESKLGAPSRIYTYFPEQPPVELYVGEGAIRHTKAMKEYWYYSPDILGPVIWSVKFDEHDRVIETANIQ
jgi:hypothetical protein